MGKMYEELRQVAHLDHTDTTELDAYKLAAQRIAECREKAGDFVKNTGMSGATHDAAVAWLVDYLLALDQSKDELSSLKGNYDIAHRSMITATDEYHGLSTELISPAERAAAMAVGTFVLPPPIGVVAASVYLAVLEKQRDAQREAAASAFLDKMNNELRRASQSLSLDVPDPGTPDDSPSNQESNSWPSSRGSSASDGSSAGSGRVSATPDVPPSFRAPEVGMSAPEVGVRPPEWWRPPSSGPGSPRTPIDKIGDFPPEDITDTPIAIVNPDGKVGGHYPPSVLDGDDPRWKDSYSIPGVPSPVAKVGLVAGGIIGVGATALASGTMGAALSGSSALAFGTATGSGSAAGIAGADLAARNGGARAPGGGMLAGQGTAAASGGSGAGRKSSAGKGMTATNAGASRGDDKKRRRRGLVGYDVLRLDDNSAEFSGPGDLAGAGSSDGLAPLVPSDDGDRW